LDQARGEEESIRPLRDLNHQIPKENRRISLLLVISCLPLAFALFEIPWYFAVVNVDSYFLGNSSPASPQTELMKDIAEIPIALGGLLGMTAIFWLIVKRRITIPVMWACLFVGLIACSIAGRWVSFLLGYP
jgi:hypothetical protein